MTHEPEETGLLIDPRHFQELFLAVFQQRLDEFERGMNRAVVEIRRSFNPYHIAKFRRHPKRRSKAR